MALEISGPDDGEVNWTIDVPAVDRLTLAAGELQDRLAAAVATVRTGGGGPCRLWIGNVVDSDDDLAAQFGFSAYRDLWQLRAPLPATPSGLTVRPFEPGDAEAVLEVNRRAFSRHPEQGAMNSAELRARQAEPWYDPAGFLLHERDGRLAGFCWTKVHPGGNAPPDDVAMGEIYVICVDPDFQGQGIGVPLTLAGLEYLHSCGPRTAMLYVESDNGAANAVYRRLGFRRHHTNRAYAAVL